MPARSNRCNTTVCAAYDRVCTAMGGGPRHGSVGTHGRGGLPFRDLRRIR